MACTKLFAFGSRTRLTVARQSRPQKAARPDKQAAFFARPTRMSSSRQLFQGIAGAGMALEQVLSKLLDIRILQRAAPAVTRWFSQ
jgi:hypothetical protein